MKNISTKDNQLQMMIDYGFLLLTEESISNLPKDFEDRLDKLESLITSQPGIDDHTTEQTIEFIFNKYSV